MTMARRDRAELLLLAAVWGASFLFMRAGAADFGPLALVFVRVGGASLVLLPLLLWRGEVGGCVESVPKGATRPIVSETFPVRVDRNYFRSADLPWIDVCLGAIRDGRQVVVNGIAAPESRKRFVDLLRLCRGGGDFGAVPVAGAT